MFKFDNLKVKYLFVFFAFNCCAALIIGYRYLGLNSADSTGFLNIYFKYSVWLTHFISLNLLAFILSLLLNLIIPFPKIIKIAIPALFTLLQIFIFTDYHIYRIYHFHFNGLVLTTLLTPGIWDSIHLDFINKFFMFFIPVIFFIMEIAVLNLIIKKIDFIKFFKKKFYLYFFGLFLAILLTEKLIYAYGDLYNKIEVLEISRIFPAYQKFTVKRAAVKYFGFNIKKNDNLIINSKNYSLDYPKPRFQFNSFPVNYNVLIIFIESLRFDMLDKNITPNLYEFSKKNIVFKNHYSSGNTTRFGIFGAIYGLYANYWHSFLSARKSPVLIDALKKYNYDFKILSSSKLTFPEFNKTVFANVQDYIEDSLNGKKPSERDKKLTDKFNNWIANRKSGKPFFSFLFFDSSHQSYSFPEEFAKFKPYSESVNYLDEDSEKNRDLIFARYKNSLYYVDYLLNEIFLTLDKNKILDNTIVIVTGDHGEEFWEYGNFGHNQKYNDYQTKTVFVARFPGYDSKEYSHITSHLDIAPTIMKSLGDSNDIMSYAQGENLFEPHKKQYFVLGGWADSAIFIENKYKITVGTSDYNMSKNTLTDFRDNEITQTKDILSQIKRSYFLNILNDLSEFRK
ncbi:MAG TPA: sulfatase-like hydrolase/transferase [bacterium]|nr:sulfatase-like hydrolase/transferase [bacterium]